MACNPSNTFSGPLVIKYYAGDTGGRPISPCDGTNPNNPPYLNPNIWLEGGIDAGTAKVGVVNTVKARVTNVGAPTLSDIQVEFFVCNFTLGINAASALASSNPGGAPLTGFHAGPVSQNTSVDIQATWTPAAADASVNGGHVCIAANAFAQDPQTGGPVGANDFQVCCNSFQGQRNIAVRNVVSGHAAPSIRIFVGNPSVKVAQKFTVEMVEARGSRAFRAFERNHLLTGPWVKKLTAAANVPKTGLFTHMPEIKQPGVGDLYALRLSRFKVNKFQLLPGPEAHFNPGLRITLPLAPKQALPIDIAIELNRKEPPGSLHVFDLVQRDEKGDMVGGARVITLITPG
jgi:hypothetical protein